MSNDVMSSYERAGKALERMKHLRTVWDLDIESQLLNLRWIITETITDALLAQVEHARKQAPSIHIHIGSSSNEQANE